MDTNENADDIEVIEMKNICDETISREDSNQIGDLKPEATDNVSAENSTSVKNRYWNYMKKCYHMFTIIILSISMLLWNAADAAIDVYLYYQLETGEAIHESIYRNTFINYGILGFAVYGCLNMIFWIQFSEWIKEIAFQKNHEGFKKLDELSLSKLCFVAFTFCLEDGPELFLEYFYVEKYMTKQLTWYLFARDIVLSMVSLYAMVHSCLFLKLDLENLQNKLAGSKYNKRLKYFAINSYKIIIVCNFSVGLLFFLRSGGAGYQYVTGKLQRSCFVVENGLLLQTPFAVGCMREVDYAILVLGVISMLFSMVASCSLGAFLIIHLGRTKVLLGKVTKFFF